MSLNTHMCRGAKARLLQRGATFKAAVGGDGSAALKVEAEREREELRKRWSSVPRQLWGYDAEEGRRHFEVMLGCHPGSQPAS